MEILNDLEKVRFNLEVSLGEIENILIAAKDFKKSALSCIKKVEKVNSIEEFEAKVFKDSVATSENIMKFISKFSTYLEMYTWHIKYAKADKKEK